jgi:hypothetical protein
MNPRTTLVRGVAAAALLTATVGLAGPAAAETTTVIDGADATASLSDIRRVTLAHRTSDVSGARHSPTCAATVPPASGSTSTPTTAARGRSSPW